MRKTYMQPAMMLVKTETEVMICQSPGGYNSTPNSDPTAEEGKGDNALGKRRGIFSGDSEGSGSIW